MNRFQGAKPLFLHTASDTYMRCYAISQQILKCLFCLFYTSEWKPNQTEEHANEFCPSFYAVLEYQPHYNHFYNVKDSLTSHENIDSHSILGNNLSPRELRWQTASTLPWWKHWLKQFCLCFTLWIKIFCIDFLVKEERLYWQTCEYLILLEDTSESIWDKIKRSITILREFSENAVKWNKAEIVSWIPSDIDKYLKCHATPPNLEYECLGYIYSCLPGLFTSCGS